MRLTEILKQPTDKEFVVRGLDDFSDKELEEFWYKKKLFRKGKTEDFPILFLGLSTKDACNYACIFCYGPEFRGKEGGTPLTLDEQKKLIDEGTEMGIKSVIYCGNGEPTIDQGLTKMIKHTHDNGLISIVFTNGQLMGNDEEAYKYHGMNAKELTSFMYENGVSLVTHIESLDAELYEKITQIPGSFQKMMQALTNIQDVGFTKISQSSDGKMITRLAISAIAMKWNFFELPELLEYAHSVNAQYLCKFPSFLGRLQQNKDVFFIPSEDATLWLRENYVRKLSEKPESITVDYLHCGAWHYGIVVGNNGDIRFCYSATVNPNNRIGNVKEEPLQYLVKRREDIFVKMLEKGETCPIKAQWYKVNQNESR